MPQFLKLQTLQVSIEYVLHQILTSRSKFSLAKKRVKWNATNSRRKQSGKIWRQFGTKSKFEIKKLGLFVDLKLIVKYSKLNFKRTNVFAKIIVIHGFCFKYQRIVMWHYFSLCDNWWHLRKLLWFFLIEKRWVVLLILNLVSFQFKLYQLNLATTLTL